MEEICSRLQATCVYKATDFDMQLNDLRQKRIDLTFLPSPISSTDYKDYLYSTPYLPSTGQFIILKTTHIDSIEELKNKKIGVIETSFLKNNFLAHYVIPNNIKEYTNTTRLINALNLHQIDAILLNSSSAKYLQNNIGNLELLGLPIEFGMGYGISALKVNGPLIQKINKVLLQIEQDGTYEKIYNKYFGSD